VVYLELYRIFINTFSHPVGIISLRNGEPKSLHSKLKGIASQCPKCWAI